MAIYYKMIFYDSFFAAFHVKCIRKDLSLTHIIEGNASHVLFKYSIFMHAIMVLSKRTTYIAQY